MIVYYLESGKVKRFVRVKHINFKDGKFIVSFHNFKMKNKEKPVNCLLDVEE